MLQKPNKKELLQKIKKNKKIDNQNINDLSIASFINYNAPSEIIDNHYKYLLENTKDVFWTMDINMKTIYVSPSILQFRGFTVEEHLTHTLEEKYTPESVSKIKKLLNDKFQLLLKGVLIDNDFPVNIELEYYKKDKSTVWAEVLINLLKDATGKIIGISGYSRDINEKKKTENALKESNRRLGTLIDNLPGVVYRCKNDRKWTIEFISNRFQQLSGYSPDDIINNKKISFSQIIHPDDLHSDWGLIQRNLKKHHPFLSRYRIICANGDVKWVWERGEGVYNEKGEIIAIEGFISDITKHILTGEALKESEERYKILFELANDAIFIIHDNNFVDCNLKATKLFNAKRDNIIGLTPWVFSPLNQPNGELSESFAKRKIKLASSGKPQYFEWQHLNNNTTLDTEITLTNASISGINYVIAVVRNISERKKVEAALLENEKKYRLIFENSPIGITHLDINGYITACNKAQLNITEKSIEETIGINAIETELNKTIKSKIKIALSGTASFYEGEYNPFKSKKLFIKANISPIFNTKNKVQGVIILTEDITERKQYESSLKEAKHKAEEADQLKSAFLANMSHEIRTPMNAIIGFSDLLLTPDITEEKKNQYVKFIYNSGNSLLNLINDIIDLAKIEAGQIVINKVNCFVYKILSDLYVAFNEEKIKDEKENIDLRFFNKKNNTDLIINTDPYRLRQILTNLIGNAIKFTEEGFVEFGFKIKDNEIVFYVKDSGIGIDKNHINIIFDRFRQINNSNTRKYGGTGLGLSITKSLVELINGKIWVESELHLGSTFYVSIPRNNNNENTNKMTTQLKTEELKFNWNTKTILVVEDDDINYLFIHEVLSPTNIKIHWAKNGKEAISICKKNTKFDLVLMDIQLPIVNGLEATRKIQQIYPQIRIIAQTAYAMVEDKQKCIDAGCCDYITKPIKPKDLIKIVSKYIL